MIFFGDTVKSALDEERIANSREVGTVGVFAPILDGRPLTFRASGGAIIDDETGSTWSLLGRAASGPLTGKQLTPLPHTVSFAFAWLVFRPGTDIVRPKPAQKQK